MHMTFSLAVKSIRSIATRAQVRALPLPTRIRSSAAPFSTSLPRRDDFLPPYAPVGVARALACASESPSTRPTIFTHEFSLADRVALVTGAHRGLGLEMALALVEAGARAVYCVDLPKAPGEQWLKVRQYVESMQGRTGGEGRLEYVCADVRDQDRMWKLAETIGDREGRLDACIAAAAVVPPAATHCLTYPGKQFQEVLNVNLNGVLYTAQAAGQQMARFGTGGSITMVASVAGSVGSRGLQFASYDVSKAGVLQLARTMACELGPKGIRVNTISPGAFRTPMAKEVLKTSEYEKPWAERHQLGRIGHPHELRGVAVWLASDASSFCTGSDFFVSGGYQAW